MEFGGVVMRLIKGFTDLGLAIACFWIFAKNPFDYGPFLIGVPLFVGVVFALCFITRVLEGQDTTFLSEMFNGLANGKVEEPRHLGLTTKLDGRERSLVQDIAKELNNYNGRK